MTVIKIQLGYFLAIIFGLIGAGLAFAALFSNNIRFWLIDEYVGGPHDALALELAPFSLYERFVFWTGVGVFAVAATIAIVSLIRTIKRFANDSPNSTPSASGAVNH